jgi:hypothetical protein
MAEQYSGDDKAKHTELSIKKATGKITSEEEDELSELRKKKQLQEALDGKNN